MSSGKWGLMRACMLEHSEDSAEDICHGLPSVGIGERGRKRRGVSRMAIWGVCLFVVLVFC